MTGPDSTDLYDYFDDFLYKIVVYVEEVEPLKNDTLAQRALGGISPQGRVILLNYAADQRMRNHHGFPLVDRSERDTVHFIRGHVWIDDEAFIKLAQP
ncbi:hypothetical protein SCOR_33005 [Sulfidibacter corallicola]|uniref:Uncharacterized protein n=1 Tax=Sulfidibacter corallicola TaxID=2818388 RepID=A0A8A4THW3_SULCO|nr:hypothetical protein [Sulfidibacter corallicola]QTD49639.1 hypothetical protein J3U87_28995 [Sulfidibacter corallicola]